jgi:hypothetical protein
MSSTRILRVALAASALFLALLAIPALASATAPWWHLSSNSRPTYLHAGAGEPGANEVQEVTVKATGGGFVLANMSEEEVENGQYTCFLGPEEEEEIPKYAEFTFNASAAEVQAGLETICGYGPGSIEVSGGPGDATGSSPYMITFIGPLAEAPLRLVNTEIGAEGGVGGPLQGTIEATETTAGHPKQPDGEIYLTAVNVGDANAEGSKHTISLTDVLPPGLAATGIAATKSQKEGNFQQREPIPCDPATLTCTMKETLVPFDTIELLIAVNVKAGAHTGELNEATISGGGGPSATVKRPITINPDPVPFGVSEFEMALEEEGGEAPTQAGRHPFQFTTQIAVNQNRDINPLLTPPEYRPEVTPAGLAKDFDFKLPPGLVGSATSIPQCTTAQFFATVEGKENKCPPSTAVGVAVATVHEPATVGTSTITEPIFNLEPNFGEPARFGFYVVLANSPVFIDTSLRSGSDYGITASVQNLTQTGSVLSSTATFWGTPGDSRHDGQRGWGCIYEARNGTVNQPCTPSEEGHPKPFLSMPTSCASPLLASGDLDQWNVGLFEPFSGTFAPSGLLTGCNQLPFSPTVAVEPTATAATTPTGLTVDLDLKQEGLENDGGLAESHLKKITLGLPQGLTTNPSIANGLGACTFAQYQSEALGSQSCPESSKVGEVEIETPLVKQIVRGSVYVAKQNDNGFPNPSLLAIYVVAKNPELGVLVRSAGRVVLDPQTGQLTSVFDELPQLPFSHLHFAFRTGQRAPLITPGLCGKYNAGTDLYPYSQPNAPIHRDASFEVSAGADGAPCARQESQLPNKPSLEAGTVTPIAGAYAPFVFKVSREDGSQALSTIAATLPEGLLGRLAGIPACAGPQIAAAQSRSGEGQGAAELASSSCPAASQVGVVNAATGAGTQPYYVQGRAYLAGPYKGAPLSLAIITPAVVGPFDLGSLVIRTALYVDPETAQIHAVSDPIPAILHGLPTVVRSVSLEMNRPNFTLNPTSCDPMQIVGSETSTLDLLAPLAERFPVGACGALTFKPKLSLALKGASHRRAHPAIVANLAAKPGEANIARAQVTLPKAGLLDNAHIKTICTRVEFAAEACPSGSIYGKASATSPLLDYPVTGPVYLRSSSHQLPDLVADLHGPASQPIRVALIGRTDSAKNGALRNTFEATPDVPVSKFHLKLFGGKRGLVILGQGLCAQRQAKIRLTAHNGKTEDTQPAVKASCGKRKTMREGHRTALAAARRWESNLLVR